MKVTDRAARVEGKRSACFHPTLRERIEFTFYWTNDIRQTDPGR